MRRFPEITDEMRLIEHDPRMQPLILRLGRSMCSVNARDVNVQGQVLLVAAQVQKARRR